MNSHLRFKKNKIFFFVPGVILDRFGYAESIYLGRKSKILYLIFYQKLIFYNEDNSWTQKT